MNGPAKITDCIKKRDGIIPELPNDSYFEVTFKDGSKASEKDVNWSDMSIQKQVSYFGGTKQVRVCNFPVQNISIFHSDLETTIEVPDGCEVYQAIRSQIIAFSNKGSKGNVFGRCVGIVRNNEVLEERFLNGRQHEMLGMRK